MQGAKVDNELKFTVKSESHDPVCPFSAAGTGVCEFSMAASGTTLGMADLFSSSFFFLKQLVTVVSLSHISNLNPRILLHR